MLKTRAAACIVPLQGCCWGPTGTGGVLAARVGSFPETPPWRISTTARCSPSLVTPYPAATVGKGPGGQLCCCC